MLIKLLVENFFKFVNNVDLSIKKSIVTEQLRRNNVNAIYEHKNLINFFFDFVNNNRHILEKKYFNV